MVQGSEPERRVLWDNGGVVGYPHKVTFTQVGWLVCAAAGTKPVLLDMGGQDFSGCACFSPVFVEGPNE